MARDDADNCERNNRGDFLLAINLLTFWRFELDLSFYRRTGHNQLTVASADTLRRGQIVDGYHTINHR